MDYLIYDCEIIRCIPTNEPRDSSFEYCEGWSDFEEMGISVIGCYWSDSDEYDCWENGYWGRNDIYQFLTGDEPLPYVIGFNSKSFDDNLLKAHGVDIATDYDLLEEVRIAAGFGRDYQSVPKGFSYALGKLGEANGFPKTGSGELAPQLWQRGERQAVIDYCLNDVRITKALLDLGLAGELIDPNTGNKLQLRPLG